MSASAPGNNFSRFLTDIFSKDLFGVDTPSQVDTPDISVIEKHVTDYRQLLRDIYTQLHTSDKLADSVADELCDRYSTLEQRSITIGATSLATLVAAVESGESNHFIVKFNNADALVQYKMSLDLNMDEIAKHLRRAFNDVTGEIDYEVCHEVDSDRVHYLLHISLGRHVLSYCQDFEYSNNSVKCEIGYDYN